MLMGAPLSINVLEVTLAIGEAFATAPGRDVDGLLFAMTFLPQQNRRVGGEPPSVGPQVTAVVVIGGGDTGSDCIGAQSVAVRHVCLASAARLEIIRDTGTGLYIHTQAVDITTPAGRAMFGMLGIRR